MSSDKEHQSMKRKVYYQFTRCKLFIPNLINKNKPHKYLFILSPPFCGSTLLNQLISTSQNISCNNNIGTREGQTLPEVRSIMFESNRWDKNLSLPLEKIKTIWHKYWDLSKPILLEKSTPNIMRVNDIKKCFNPISFICMVRNPYAQCEGIIRRNGKSAEFAAKFALNCLQYQKVNIENEKNLLFFTYEDLCENKSQVVNKIISFMPDLKDVKSEKKFKAHNFKTNDKMEITNLNHEKIAKLTTEQLNEINYHFKEEEELLKYFNYTII
jgi:hypothetical protein